MCRPKSGISLENEYSIFNVGTIHAFFHARRREIIEKTSVHYKNTLTSKTDQNLRQGSRNRATCKCCE